MRFEVFILMIGTRRDPELLVCVLVIVAAPVIMALIVIRIVLRLEVYVVENDTKYLRPDIIQKLPNSLDHLPNLARLDNKNHSIHK